VLKIESTIQCLSIEWDLEVCLELVELAIHAAVALASVVVEADGVVNFYLTLCFGVAAAAGA
jgi:hypothetical protein